MNENHRLAAAARSLVGSPFKLHGRCAINGLDCVGLLALSLEMIGRASLAPTGYAFRNRTIDHWLPLASGAGLFEGQPPVRAGDVLLTHAGCQQHHILIADSKNSVIHAHAGLRRVVHEPWRTGDRLRLLWRLAN
ncbi:MAG: hypothetical protein AAFR64_07445 [Pseudomonadota bacterium]